MSEPSVEGCVAREVDYESLPCLYGQHKHIRTACTQQAPINIISGAPFDFPVTGDAVVNLGYSYLEFDIAIAAAGVANTNIWMLGGDCLSLFKTVSFEPQSGVAQRTDSYHHWSKLALPYLLSPEELKSNDIANLVFPSRSTGSQNKLPANGFDSVIPYEDFAHAIPLDGGVPNTPVLFHVVLPLELFVGTVLADKRDHFFGISPKIAFELEDPDKWLFFNTASPNDPSGGTPAVLNATSKATLQLQNVYLNLAVEQDMAVINTVKAAYSRGYSAKVPMVVRMFNTAKTGTAQQVQVTSINAAKGQKLMRVFTGAFGTAAGAETINNSLNNCNQLVNPLTDVSTNRIISYQTTYKGVPRQNRYIYASPNLQFGNATAYNSTTMGGIGDWATMKQYYEGSCVFSAGALGLNYAIIDDFTSRESRLKKNLDYSYKDEGVSLLEEDGQYQVDAVTSNNTNVWYNFMQVYRTLLVRPGEMTIM